MWIFVGAIFEWTRAIKLAIYSKIRTRPCKFNELVYTLDEFYWLSGKDNFANTISSSNFIDKGVKCINTLYENFNYEFLPERREFLSEIRFREVQIQQVRELEH